MPKHYDDKEKEEGKRRLPDSFERAVDRGEESGPRSPLFSEGNRPDFISPPRQSQRTLRLGEAVRRLAPRLEDREQPRSAGQLRGREVFLPRPTEEQGESFAAEDQPAPQFFVPQEQGGGLVEMGETGEVEYVEPEHADLPEPTEAGIPEDYVGGEEGPHGEPLPPGAKAYDRYGRPIYEQDGIFSGGLFGETPLGNWLAGMRHRWSTGPDPEAQIDMQEKYGEIRAEIRGEFKENPLLELAKRWGPVGIVHGFKSGEYGLGIQALQDHLHNLSNSRHDIVALPSRLVNEAVGITFSGIETTDLIFEMALGGLALQARQAIETKGEDESLYHAIQRESLGFFMDRDEQVAARMAYTGLFHLGRFSEAHRRIADGEDPMLVKAELEDPIIEAIGQVALGVAGIDAFGAVSKLGTISRNTRLLRNAENWRLASPEWAKAFDEYQTAATAAEKASSAERMRDIMMAEAKAFNAQLDARMAKRGFWAMTAEGKRSWVAESTYDFMLQVLHEAGRTADGGIDLERAQNLMLATALAHSDDADDVLRAAEIMADFEGRRIIWGDQGKMAGRMIRRMLDEEGDMAWLTKALDDAGDDMSKLSETLFARVKGTVDDYVPKASDLIKEEQEVVKRLGDETDLSRDELIRQELGRDPVPGWQRKIVKFDATVTQGIYGPINKFLAAFYMGMSPGYWARNWMSNHAHIIIDQGFRSALRTGDAADDLTFKWLGFLPYTTEQAFGGPVAASLMDTNYWENGSWLKRLATTFSRKSQEAELIGAKKVVAAQVERTMKSMIEVIGRDEDIVNILGDSLNTRYGKQLLRRLRQNYGDVDSVVDWFRKSADDGYLEGWRNIFALKDEQIELLQKHGVFDLERQVLNAMEQASSPEDFAQRIDGVVEGIEDLAARAAYEPTGVSPDDLDNIEDAVHLQEATEGGYMNRHKGAVFQARLQADRDSVDAFMTALDQDYRGIERRLALRLQENGIPTEAADQIASSLHRPQAEEMSQISQRAREDHDAMRTQVRNLVERIKSGGVEDSDLHREVEAIHSNLMKYLGREAETPQLGVLGPKEAIDRVWNMYFAARNGLWQQRRVEIATKVTDYLNDLPRRIETEIPAHPLLADQDLGELPVALADEARNVLMRSGNLERAKELEQMAEAWGALDPAELAAKGAAYTAWPGSKNAIDVFAEFGIPSVSETGAYFSHKGMASMANSGRKHAGLEIQPFIPEEFKYSNRLPEERLDELRGAMQGWVEKHFSGDAELFRVAEGPADEAVDFTSRVEEATGLPIRPLETGLEEVGEGQVRVFQGRPAGFQEEGGFSTSWTRDPEFARNYAGERGQIYTKVVSEDEWQQAVRRATEEGVEANEEARTLQAGLEEGRFDPEFAGDARPIEPDAPAARVVEEGGTPGLREGEISPGEALDRLKGLGSENPLNPRQTVLEFDEGIVKIEATQEEGALRIDLIEVPPDQRGSGLASRALEEIKSVSDETGVQIRLTPEPAGEEGLSGDELVSWYSRHGFNETDGGDLVYLPDLEGTPPTRALEIGPEAAEEDVLRALEEAGIDTAALRGEPTTLQMRSTYKGPDVPREALWSNDPMSEAFEYSFSLENRGRTAFENMLAPSFDEPFEPSVLQSAMQKANMASDAIDDVVGDLSRYEVPTQDEFNGMIERLMDRVSDESLDKIAANWSAANEINPVDEALGLRGVLTDEGWEFGVRPRAAFSEELHRPGAASIKKIRGQAAEIAVAPRTTPTQMRDIAESLRELGIPMDAVNIKVGVEGNSIVMPFKEFAKTYMGDLLAVEDEAALWVRGSEATAGPRQSAMSKWNELRHPDPSRGLLEKRRQYEIANRGGFVQSQFRRLLEQHTKAQKIQDRLDWVMEQIRRQPAVAEDLESEFLDMIQSGERFTVGALEDTVKAALVKAEDIPVDDHLARAEEALRGVGAAENEINTILESMRELDAFDRDTAVRFWETAASKLDEAPTRFETETLPADEVFAAARREMGRDPTANPIAFPATHGAPSSSARMAHENLEGVTKLLEDIKTRVQENWGRVERFEANAEDIRRVENWAKAVKPRMAEARSVASELATGAREFTLHNYERRHGYDLVAQYLYPYQFWYSRTYMNWARRIAARPTLVAQYSRYRRLLEREHAGQPDWWKYNVNTNELFGFDHDNPLYFNLEQSLNPLQGLVGVDFEDQNRRKRWFGAMLDEAGRFGPTVWMPYQLAAGIAYKAEGEDEAAAAMVGRFSGQSRMIRSAAALAGADIETDPFVHIFSDGVDYWERRRIGRMLAEFVQEGRYSEAEILDAARNQDGPIWEEAKMAQLQRRAPGQLASSMLGTGFKGRRQEEILIDQFFADRNSLFMQRDNLSPDEYSRAWDELRVKYPFMDALLLSRQPTAERDAAFTYNVLGRIPPGQQGDWTDRADIPDELVNRFYETKGAINEWSEGDRLRLMSGIVNLGAVLAVPERTTRAEWTQVRAEYRSMQSTMKQVYGPDIDKLIDGFFDSKNQGPEASEEYLERFPQVEEAMDWRTAFILRHPVLKDYYGGVDTLERYHKGLMYNEAQDLFGEDIFDLQSMFFQIQDAGGNTRGFLRAESSEFGEHSRLRDYWDWREEQIEIINDRIANFGETLGEISDVQLREDIEESAIGAEAVLSGYFEARAEQVDPNDIALEGMVREWLDEGPDDEEGFGRELPSSEVYATFPYEYIAGRFFNEPTRVRLRRHFMQGEPLGETVNDRLRRVWDAMGRPGDSYYQWREVILRRQFEASMGADVNEVPAPLGTGGVGLPQGGGSDRSGTPPSGVTRYIKAEDGSYVPESFYPNPPPAHVTRYVKAEDGSYVPLEFYDETSY